jgi:hypothetical protein
MFDQSFLDELNHFIVKAKTVSYVGSGETVPGCRLNSHDLEFVDGDFTYRDSYFGGQNFLGEEVVWHKGQPVWGENYFGEVMRTDLIDGAGTGQVIKISLTKMYAEGRFLGGFQHVWQDLVYTDENSGDLASFSGREVIHRNGVLVYQLYYHGGVII